MRTKNSSYIPSEGAFPFQGVNYLTPSDMLDPRYSPEMSNVDITKGHLSKRKGYTTYGSALNGTVLAIVEFTNISGTTNVVAITTTKEYKWNGSDWSEITYQNSGGSTVNRTGTESDGVDWVVTTGYDSTGSIAIWLIFTNGVDPPRYWNGTTSRFYLFSTDSVANKGAALQYTNFVTCKTLGVLNNYLVMGNVTTTANEPKTLVWSDGANMTDFENNNSAAIPLTDASGKILKLLLLGDRLTVYSEDTIHQMIHVGGNDIFNFERVLTNTRLLSQRAVVDLETFHMFMGQENVYFFDGTRLLRSIGDAITLRYREILDSSSRTYSWAVVDKPRNHIYFAVPRSSDENQIFKAEYDLYNIQDIKWMPQEYASRVTSIGFAKRSSRLTWGAASIATFDWLDMAGVWNQGSTEAGFPQRILGHESGTSVADETLFVDSSSAIEATYETVDFVVPKDFISEYGRWCELEFEARGSRVDVYYSTDHGGTYNLLDEVSLDGSWTRYRLDFDTVGRQIRFKFMNSQASSGFELRWFRGWVNPTGAW